MKIPDTLLTIAFVGMKHEADDIVDYLMIQLSLWGSLLLGTILAILTGRAAGAWIGLAAGIGAYGISMRICSAALVHSHHNR